MPLLLKMGNPHLQKGDGKPAATPLIHHFFVDTPQRADEGDDNILYYSTTPRRLYTAIAILLCKQKYAAFLLHISFREPQINGSIYHLAILKGSDSAVDFRVITAVEERCVLA